MVNPRNAYQKYNVATNSTGRTLYTYMGELLPKCGNVTYSGAGDLSPLSNDPDYETIGTGTRIFLCGAEGYIVGEGTQHSPKAGFGTLMVAGDLKEMNPEYLRGAIVPKYGTSLFVGMGIPIPILNVGLAEKTGVSDEEIVTNVLDYGIPRRDRPILRKVTYAELKSGKIEINGQEVRTNPLSSFKKAREIAEVLKKWMEEKRFFLSMPAKRLSTERVFKPMPLRKTPRVADIMTADIVTVKKEDTLKEVAGVMIKKEINHLPVVDEEKRVIGIVTSWDISKAVSQGLRSLERIMTKEVITTSQEELVEEAARKMAKHDISGLPVVDEAGRIKGIVTAEDVSKYIGGMKIGKI
jgi:CBS domain-containing protein